jgi:hypothetical protein
MAFKMYGNNQRWRDCGTHMAAQPACGTYKAHILGSFPTFDLKSHRKNEFYKKTSSINERDSMPED